MTAQEILINNANKHLGYHEGTNNYNIFAADLVKWIGGPYSQNAAWCDMFVDHEFIESFGLDLAKQMIGGWSAYTPTSAQYYKNMGRYSHVPQVGDQIFFKNNKGICHTGIVVEVTDTTVKTIEGNKSDSVMNCTYKLNDSTIDGYGHPKYELVTINQGGKETVADKKHYYDDAWTWAKNANIVSSSDPEESANKGWFIFVLYKFYQLIVEKFGDDLK